MLVTSAIPTVYKSVRFRSRLEARWAAFFDLCGWPWEYEPLDLVGYIPDFVLPFARPLLAEVKPLLALNDPAWELVQGKIERSGWGGEALILGASLFVGGGGENFADDVQIGMLAERCVFDADGSLAPLPGAERVTTLHAGAAARVEFRNRTADPQPEPFGIKVKVRAHHPREELLLAGGGGGARP